MPESPDFEQIASAILTGPPFRAPSFGQVHIKGTFSSDGFEYRFQSLAAGATATIGALQFAKQDGTRFNPLLVKAQRFVITATRNGKQEVFVGGWE